MLNQSKALNINLTWIDFLALKAINNLKKVFLGLMFKVTQLIPKIQQ